MNDKYGKYDYKTLHETLWLEMKYLINTEGMGDLYRYKDRVIKKMCKIGIIKTLEHSCFACEYAEENDIPCGHCPCTSVCENEYQKLYKYSKNVTLRGEDKFKNMNEINRCLDAMIEGWED